MQNYVAQDLKERDLTRSFIDVDDVGLDKGEVPSHVGFMPDGCLIS